ncbi:MAG: YaaL family protein [Limnochordia bacterium]|jgi:hypothetical protein|nr:YaaL family protein [Bacillota bacterium]
MNGRQLWTSIRDVLNRQLRLFEEEEETDELDNEDVVREAHQEWVGARNFFDNVTDPALVDYAIYAMQAAEKRYMYLLKRARDRDGDA